MSRLIENPRGLILNEAKKILYNEGYSKISIRRVAKECNISIGTIYNYFPTKKELIVEMMTNFWEEYFYNIKPILNTEESFYEKLNNIFNNLAEFIKRFREVWLKNELYSSPDYIESGLKKENIYINKLILTIKELLEKEVYNNNQNIKINPDEMARYIIMNFITMVQMPYFEYSLFENILKELIR